MKISNIGHSTVGTDIYIHTHIHRPYEEKKDVKEETVTGELCVDISYGEMYTADSKFIHSIDNTASIPTVTLKNR